MSASSTLEENFQQLLKLNAEKDAQLEYLRKQLDQKMRNNRKQILSTPSVSTLESTDDEVESRCDSSGEEEGARRQGEEKESSTKPQISKSKSRGLKDNSTPMTS